MDKQNRLYFGSGNKTRHVKHFNFKLKSRYVSHARMAVPIKIYEKMNPVIVRIFYINRHKVVTKCVTTSSTANAIFSSIDEAFEKYEISLANCVDLRVDNASVNIGKHKSIIVEAGKEDTIILIGCPCLRRTTLAKRLHMLLRKK